MTKEKAANKVRCFSCSKPLEEKDIFRVCGDNKTCSKECAKYEDEYYAMVITHFGR